MSAATLFQHDGGRYAVASGAESPAFTRNDPAWHRVGPVDVSALALPAPGGWQPIETAPKDGIAVLVYQKIDSAHWLTTPAYFVDGEWLIVCFHDGNVEYEIDPTHWMHLPDAPKAVGAIA